MKHISQINPLYLNSRTKSYYYNILHIDSGKITNILFTRLQGQEVFLANRLLVFYEHSGTLAREGSVISNTKFTLRNSTLKWTVKFQNTKMSN